MHPLIETSKYLIDTVSSHGRVTGRGVFGVGVIAPKLQLLCVSICVKIRAPPS